jgi:hypothetical protein
LGGFYKRGHGAIDPPHTDITANKQKNLEVAILLVVLPSSLTVAARSSVSFLHFGGSGSVIDEHSGSMSEIAIFQQSDWNGGVRSAV